MNKILPNILKFDLLVDSLSSKMLPKIYYIRLTLRCLACKYWITVQDVIIFLMF